MSIKSSVEKLPGIEEGIVSLLKKVASLATKVALLRDKSGSSKVASASQTKKKR